MDSSTPFPLFSSLRVVGDMNDRSSISHLSPEGPFNDRKSQPFTPARPTVFSLSEQQPAEIRPTGIEVAWPVTASLGVRVLKENISSGRLNFYKEVKKSFNLTLKGLCEEFRGNRGRFAHFF
ncbi:hypothetical protein AVEN_106621-1 [Araneus ventricosus]|uniref:Uncharacterized protein n=1 Tax=Araneus ventricosus TaxID=182803 RepID=A0A4Y2I4I7_ARAVE|nr:hypothetical protein AVEN_106621-1 [Araneus ventricosus]